MYKPKPSKERRSSKCFVVLLATFVTFCTFLLVSALVLRVRNPEIKLRSVTLRQISYSASPSASFNATLINNFRIKNPNFGAFDYEKSIMSVLYDGVKFGDTEIGNGTVKNGKSKEFNVGVNVKSVKELPIEGNLSRGINSGTLNLTSYVKISGTVHVLKIFNKRKIVELVCTMNLNLTTNAIQGIQC